MTYAKGTKVSIDKSKAELEKLLTRHGAGSYATVSDFEEGKAAVLFTLKKRQYRLQVPLPKYEDFKKQPRSSWRNRTAKQQQVAWDQACRERWRGVVLIVKAKLEHIALGLSTVEREFLADLVLPNGQSMHQALEEQIEKAIKTGTPFKLLEVGS